MPRFENVSCSQCGEAFGPGDNGFSHCEDHLLLSFRKCLCSISFTRAGHDVSDMSPAQKAGEAATSADAMTRARQIWADNPGSHDDLLAVFAALNPLVEMREFRRAK